MAESTTTKPKMPCTLDEREGIFTIYRRSFKITQLCEGEILTREKIMEIHAAMNFIYKDGCTDACRFRVD